MNLTIPMPDCIPESRRAVWDYYGFVGLDADGYPLFRSKVVDGMTVAHPIHGAYLITEYIKQYERARNDTTSLTRALALASASVQRMDLTCVSCTMSTTASPLTNSTSFQLSHKRDICPFSRDFIKILKSPDFSVWADMLCQSLLLPVGEGGVFLEKEDVITFEEYPTQIPSTGYP